MRIERKARTLLASILLVSLLLSFIPQTTISQEAVLQGEEKAGAEPALFDTMVAGIPHGTILIVGDDEFRTIAEGEVWDGDGSEEHPYIIEGFDFDLGGTNGRCIDISDTTVHFIIRNCSFTGATGMGGTGIRVNNVTSCEISDNILYNNYLGIFVDAENATVVNNDIDVIELGVGIYGQTLKNSLISGNTVNGGYVGLNLQGLNPCVISHNTITNSIEVSVYLEFSDNVTLSDNDLINGSLAGLYLYFSDNCTLIRNTISYCGDGILLERAHDNFIKECTLERNTNGIYFDYSSDNVMEFCEIRHNGERGTVVDGSSRRNLIKWNVFLNHSMLHVLCDGIVNIFDYNYYDTYSGTDVDGNGIGDFPHPLWGTAENADYHPLLLEPTFPVWNPSPSNQYMEFGDRFSYDLEVSSPVPIEHWRISGTTHFMIDDTGTITDLDVLDVGIYLVNVLVTNTHALSVEGSFTVTVEDTVSPVWISQIQDQTHSYGDDIEIQLIAWDLAGIDSWDISDSENFSISYTSFAETGILRIVDIGSIAAGSYPLIITAYDPSGNYVTAAFTVTVSDTGPSGAISFEFIMSTGGLALGLVALIIAIVAFINTRKGL